jgi:hypothetical protein
MSDEFNEMDDDIKDEMIERIVARLRPLPEVDPAARARVLVAVAAERERDRERRRLAARPRRVAWWTAAAAAVAAAVALAVILPRRNDVSPGAPHLASSPALTPAQLPMAGPATLAAGDAGAAALRPVQLVFRAPAAHRVSVVGDFSGWDPGSAVMTRDSGSGLWSVTLRLTPGRHVYAFLVDDSVWVRDPRAPSAPDADFGRPGSVLLVGQP